MAQRLNSVFVTCYSGAYEDLSPDFKGVRRLFLNIPANGALSVLHDLRAFFCVFLKSTHIVVLGVSGFDRYFQIAKCFRDEDLRADRQPEFTQIDIEMSFCNQEDVMKVTEKVIYDVFKACGHEITIPFNRMRYKDAMEKYGSDKPDLRYDLSMIDVIDIFAKCLS